MPTAPPLMDRAPSRDGVDPGPAAGDAARRAALGKARSKVPHRVRQAAAWSAVAAAVLLVPGWLLPAPRLAVAVLNALVHIVLFAGLVTAWARAVPRLRPAVFVSAVFVAVGVEAAQVEPALGWATQTRLLWADLVGIVLGGVADRVYRRRPLPDLPFVPFRLGPPVGGDGETVRRGSDRPARVANSARDRLAPSNEMDNA